MTIVAHVRPTGSAQVLTEVLKYWLSAKALASCDLRITPTIPAVNEEAKR